MSIDIINQLQQLLQLPNAEVWLYWQFAQHLKDGLIPYLQFHPEYPPFSLFFFYIPYWVSTNPLFYTFYYHIEVLLAIIFGGFLVWRMNKDIGKVYLYLFLIWLLQASDYKLVFDRFDIFPAIITFFAFFEFFKRKKENLGWLLLAVGVMTKIFPIALFPVFFLKAKNKWTSLTFFISLIGFNAYYFFTSHGQYLQLFLTQGNRNIQIESFKTTFVLAKHWIENVPLHLVYSNYSWSLLLPKTEQGFLQALIIVSVLMPFLRGLFTIKNPAKLCVISLMAFMMYVPVLSPQYLIWLIPFIPFLETSDILFFLPVFGITSWLFSFYGATFYDGVKTINEWTLLLILTRNILLFITYYKLIIYQPKENKLIKAIKIGTISVNKFKKLLLKSNKKI